MIDSGWWSINPGKPFAANFRRTEPRDSAFCTIYAQGTIQNFAADQGKYS